jgi:hypothetical protein
MPDETPRPCPFCGGPAIVRAEETYRCIAMGHKIAGGSLTLNYEVDNELGDTNPGVYLNGTALPGSTRIGNPGEFTALQTYTDTNITADIV